MSFADSVATTGKIRRQYKKTLLASMHAVDQKRKIADGGAMDTSETIFGGRGCALVDALENSEESLGNLVKRWRVGGSHVAFVADEAVLKERARWS